MTAGANPTTSTTPLQVAPQSAPSVQPAARGGGHEQCPSCGAQMALDQRYCLQCGNRRGDPRLPFMDAVVFMDSVRQPRPGATPPPPPPPQAGGSRMSANASLIAGVATLVLAIGVGVLIGRSGESGAPATANTPQVIKVEGGGGGGGGEEAPGNEGGASSGKSSNGGESSIGGGSGKKKQAKSLHEAEHEQAATEVLKTNPNVKMAPPTVEKGGKCEPGSAGCSGSGEFNGSFFGE